MSRISAREALVASSAVSAVISLCVLGSLPGSAPIGVHKAGTSSRSTAAHVSIDAAGNRAAMTGSHQGVWFRIYDDPAVSRLSTRPDVLDAVLSGTERPTTSAAVPPHPSPASKPAQQEPTQKPAVVHEQTRSSVLAAVSNNPRDIAEAMAATHGWTGSEWVCLDKLWSHESKYETTVRNTTSGAYGIPQALPASKMASAGPDWRTNPVTQIQWGLGYIESRYGTPCGAWSYWIRHDSY